MRIFCKLKTNFIHRFGQNVLPSRVKLQRKHWNAGGVQYIEVRAIDVNPFSPVGITAEQMHFLDLFLLYCLWSDSPPLSLEQQQQN